MIFLPEADKMELRDAVRQIDYSQESVEVFLLSLYPVFARLPRRVLKAIFDFYRLPDSPGVLLLKNFPVDCDLPATPGDGKPPKGKRSFVSEACALGIAQLIGEPYGYSLEKEGQLVHNICPVPLSTYSQSNESSLGDLQFHNDIAYEINNPDFLLLACLRQDKNREARTLYSHAADICGRLTREEAGILRQPAFSIALPYSFRKESEIADVTWSAPRRVIRGSSRYPEIRVDFGSGMRGDDDESAGLLDKIERVCHEVATDVGLESGDILLVNNRKGVHARTGFTPAFDGSDRWLQRVYVRRSLWELRRERGFSRIF